MNNKMCPRCEKPHDMNLTHTCVSVSSTGILSQQEVQDVIVCRHCHRKTGNGIKGNCTCTERQEDGTWLLEGRDNLSPSLGEKMKDQLDRDTLEILQPKIPSSSTEGWEEEFDRKYLFKGIPAYEEYHHDMCGDIKAFIYKTRQEAIAQTREEVLKELVDRLSEAFALEIENRDGTKDRFCSEAKIIQIIQEDK